MYSRPCPNSTRRDHRHYCVLKLFQIQPSELIIGRRHCEASFWHPAMDTGVTNETRCARLARVPGSSLVRFPAQDEPCSRQPSGHFWRADKVPSLSAHHGVHPREGKENPALILPPLDVSFGSYISIYVGNNNNKKISVLDGLPGAMALKLIWSHHRSAC